MNARTATVAIAGVASLAVALPPVAQAKIKSVYVGVPPSAQATFQKHSSDANDFFPHGVTIHVGDKVRFVPAGFHTVDLAPKGSVVAPLITPTGAKVSGVNDAAGSPFWFNGLDQLAFNRELLSGSFGKRVTFDGKNSVNSGLPLQPKVRAMVVRFTRAGTYTYFCNVHTGMKGTVRVRRPAAHVPSAKADARSVRRQVKRDLTIAKRLARTRVPAATVDVGSAGPHGVEYFDMFPLNGLTVHVGDSVRFRMTTGSFEVHTATFGPGDPLRGAGYLGDIETHLAPTGLDPRGIYPSDPPGPLATLTASSHGNGFWNSGGMDLSNATPPAGSSSVKFGAAGDYQFYCLIHPFMHGTIHVIA